MQSNEGAPPSAGLAEADRLQPWPRAQRRFAQAAGGQHGDVAAHEDGVEVGPSRKPVSIRFANARSGSTAPAMAHKA